MMMMMILAMGMIVYICIAVTVYVDYSRVMYADLTHENQVK